MPSEDVSTCERLFDVVRRQGLVETSTDGLGSPRLVELLRERRSLGSVRAIAREVAQKTIRPAPTRLADRIDANYSFFRQIFPDSL